MLDPESEQIREVYAHFGLAIYSTQCLERELAMFIAASETSKRFAAWDYDDRLANNLESTFGALVTMFSEISEPEDQQLLAELQKALAERNELVHQYFWKRAVEFTSTNGRVEMLRELKNLVDRFDSLDGQLSERTNRAAREKGVSEEALQAHFDRILAGVDAPHDPRKIRGPITVTRACEWRLGDSVECGIVLVSDAGNLVLGRNGLVLGPQAIPKEQLKTKPEFAKALPATVNPKPRKAGAWTYVIQLANGYVLSVRPDEKDGRQIVRFGLKRNAPKVRT
jgi:hypothetical protein